jgi:DNA-binding NarL/FixJ family response regulator
VFRPVGDERQESAVAELLTQTARVTIASDFFLTREGLACLLSGVDGIDVVARVGRHGDILETVERDRPDVVVVGIRAGRAATEGTLAVAGQLRCATIRSPTSTRSLPRSAKLAADT